MNQNSVPIDPARFDVREIPCRVKHAQIFQRWVDLPVGRYFVLVNDHDPVPLYYQFEAQFSGAFTWEYLVRGPEEFQVKITRLAATSFEPRPDPFRVKNSELPLSSDRIQEIDARGLEPPEPLMLILNTLESLPAGQSLRAVTDREPCHLFGEAERRGFSHDCKQRPDGHWSTLLSRK